MAHEIGKKVVEDDLLMVLDGGNTPLYAAIYTPNVKPDQAFFLMDIRNITGAGLPFAIGVKFAAPDLPVTLICDRNSLFRNLHALRTAINFNINLRILCLEFAEAELALTESVLRGFGIPVSRFSQ